MKHCILQILPTSAVTLETS